MSDTPRVVIGDADRLARVGLRRTLERSGFEVCAETGDATMAVQACLDHQPDLCLIDGELPTGAASAIEAIATALPGTRIVIMTLSQRGEDLMAALEAGASGYLLKDMRADRLGHTLSRVLDGETTIPRRLVTPLADEVRRRRVHALSALPAVGLSAREQQVLQLLADGMGTAAVAERLGISPVTVRRHVSTLVAKLGVADRRAAVRLITERRASAGAARGG